MPSRSERFYQGRFCRGFSREGGTGFVVFSGPQDLYWVIGQSKASHNTSTKEAR